MLFSRRTDQILIGAPDEAYMAEISKHLENLQIRLGRFEIKLVALESRLKSLEARLEQLQTCFDYLQDGLIQQQQRFERLVENCKTIKCQL